MSDYDDDTQPTGQYQGWANWDTWNANLWLTNEQDAYNKAMACRDEFALNALFKEDFRDIGMSTGFTDGIDPAKVNWQEIYNNLHEGE